MIHQLMRAPDGTVRLMVQGLERIRLLDFVATEPYLVARVERGAGHDVAGVETEGLRRAVRRPVPAAGGAHRRAAGRAGRGRRDARPIRARWRTSSRRRSRCDGPARQELLELDAGRRQAAAAGRAAPARAGGARAGPEDHHRDPGADDEGAARVLPARAAPVDPAGAGRGGRRAASSAELRRKIEEATLPEEARREAERELDRLANDPAGLAGARHDPHLPRLDGEPALGQAERRRDRHRRGRAQVLDEDHYDLEKIKDRILEYLAVKKLRQDAARAAVARRGRRRVDGERRDRTEPEPHVARDADRPRRAGADPLLRRAAGRRQDQPRASPSRGRWAASSCASRWAACTTRPRSAATAGPTSARCPAASSRRSGAAETRDPVFMLDEIDKVGADWRGDPSSALLEVLDPAQNHTFVDNYLGVPFDLSQVLFIATANTLDTIPAPAARPDGGPPASGYTDEEKVADRPEVPGAEAARRSRPAPRRSSRSTDDALRRDRAGLHARGGRAEPGPGDRHASPARWRATSPRGSTEPVQVTPDERGRLPRAGRASSTRSPSGPTVPAWPRAWPGRRPAATCCSSRRR